MDIIDNTWKLNYFILIQTKELVTCVVSIVFFFVLFVYEEIIIEVMIKYDQDLHFMIEFLIVI